MIYSETSQHKPLKREVNKAFVRVTGLRVNRSVGYGLEVPCKYRLYGPMTYIQQAGLNFN